MERNWGGQGLCHVDFIVFNRKKITWIVALEHCFVYDQEDQLWIASLSATVFESIFPFKYGWNRKWSPPMVRKVLQYYWMHSEWRIWRRGFFLTARRMHPFQSCVSSYSDCSWESVKIYIFKMACFICCVDSNYVFRWFLIFFVCDGWFYLIISILWLNC